MYESLKSVFFGTDSEILPDIINLHSGCQNPLILDVTFNKGKMWEKTNFSPLRMDIDPAFPVDITADFRCLPLKNSSIDIIVFDPPHLPTNAASKNSSKIWEKRYGIDATIGRGRDGDNVSEQFIPFLTEAKRVLKPDGIVLAKIADLVHNHRYQWQHVDLINASIEIGLTPCDLLIKCDPKAGNLKSSKWKEAKHFRKAHSYWVVIRNSSRCEVKRKG